MSVRAISGDAAVERALAELAAGRPVVVVDDEERSHLRGGEGHAGARVVHGAPHFRLHLRGADRGRLRPSRLPPMHHMNADSFGTAFTVTVDARAGITTGITTGISAADRARTIALLADADDSSLDGIEHLASPAAPAG